MSHELESMMYVGETPWHKLGTKLLNAPTTSEAIVRAGLDWTVGLQTLMLADGEVVDHKATVRLSDGKVLGVVGPGYRPLQNAAAFSFFDPFLAAGEASLETAGSLREGKRVWVLAKINRAPSVIVKGDEVQKYVLLANAHDGTMAVRVGFTPIRVVCNNTLGMAVRDKGSSLVRVRHCKNTVAALDAVRDTMNAADAAFEATAVQYRRLAATPVVTADLKRYFQTVISPRVVAKKDAKAAKTQPVIAEGSAVDSILDAGGIGAGSGLVNELLSAQEKDTTSRAYDTIMEAFESGRGNTMPGVKGTMWAAYNAVTEYVSHERNDDAAKRLDAAWFGTGAAMIDRALGGALEIANARGA
jgi:phage/plasmid-like protein (TIGR03299 family)